MKSEKSYAGWYFLAVVLVLYTVYWFFNPAVVLSSLGFGLEIAKNIVPVFALVFVLMVAVNYWATPKKVASHLGKSSGYRRWVFAVLGGILSTGPIYMWYPMLKELKKKGVNYGFISTFLYNRAIKPPLIPLIIYYFGLEFTVVLCFSMLVFSVLQGIIFERMEERGVFD